MTTTPLSTLDYAPGPQPTGGAGASRRGKGALAVAATLLLPGLGHVIAGERPRGLRWFVACCILWAAGLSTFILHGLAPALIILLPLSAIVQLACLIDAYRTGHRSSRAMLGGPGRRYLVAAALLLLMLFANPQLAVALLARRYLAETFVQPTAGMSPTIVARDRFLCHKLLEPRRWDVVVFLAPDISGGRQKFVQRLVGLPGEQVEIIDGQVHINGKPIPAPGGIGAYVGVPPRGLGGLGHNGLTGSPITLGPDDYYFLGDNSPISGDSRYWRNGTPGHQPGTVGRADIIGRATWIYWPPSHWRSLEP
jgi:signal peptidase I